jgi:hypothetical protein
MIVDVESEVGGDFVDSIIILEWLVDSVVVDAVALMILLPLLMLLLLIRS